MCGSDPLETREGAGWRRLLFPDPPRSFRARRTAKISARAVHVLCAGVMVGSYLLSADDAARRAWLAATVATGFALLLIDLHESAAFLLQIRGMVILGKLGLVAALPALGSASGYVLAAVLLLSVVMSHAPSRVRYFVVFGRGHVRGACSKG
jgi:hypothetical protein